MFKKRRKKTGRQNLKKSAAALTLVHRSTIDVLFVEVDFYWKTQY
jgi:hypothetical protein